IADTNVAMVGRFHSLMSTAANADSQLAAANVEARRLQERSHEDVLTGVLNRAGLEYFGTQQLRHLHVTGESLSLVFADVDNFKTINDRFGHEKGDEALKHVASVLRETFGPTAIVGRYGGDEFIVLLGGLTGCWQAKALTLGFLQSVKQDATTTDGTSIPISLSVGGAWCKTVSAKAELRELLMIVDELMYKAKHGGAGTVLFKELAC
ncbi:MAG: GGDEF domain-containing protein, partial [Planctomycetes bacterium]|nr:GGDEF domain-containing protein [Planctomycetota bacterium]